MEIQYKNQNELKNEFIIDEKDLVINHLLYLFEDKDKAQNKEIFLEL
ncbi:hypothetical protein ACNSOO_07810 [Aliarcobacter lanthieri]